jgi:uncharacterized protein
MPQDSIRLVLRNAEGRDSGELVVANLPDRQDITFSARGDVALREAGIYRYEISIDATHVEVEPRELCDPDDASCKRGRLRPGQAVGRLRIQVVDRITGLRGTTSPTFPRSLPRQCCRDSRQACWTLRQANCLPNCYIFASR